LEESQFALVELRQYTLHPGKTRALVDLFENEFIETQEAVGMKVIGQFRDLDNPDRFVWVRAFRDMASRAQGLDAFYSGPVWRRHRDAANETMADSDNVLLLRAARPGSGFARAHRPRASRGETESPDGLVVVHIYHFDAPVDPTFVNFFDSVMRPELTAMGISILAAFVRETAPNNFPRLPIREGEHVFVWFSMCADQADYDGQLVALGASPTWRSIADILLNQLKTPLEVLRLLPTPRSELRG
jgi:hypothetical protein